VSVAGSPVPPKIDVPVFLDDGGKPRFVKGRGNCRWPVFVVSLPKSGTYFVSELLKQLGLLNAGVHMSESGFTDYRWKEIEQQNEDYLNFQHELPLSEAVQLIAPGQFAVGHLECNEHTRRCLEGFRIVVTKREARAALVSQMRFFCRPGRGAKYGTGWKEADDGPARMEAFLKVWGQELIAWYKTVAPWIAARGVVVVPFETACGDDAEEGQVALLKAVAEHLALRTTDAELLDALRKAAATQTMTSSGRRSALSDYWSSRCESLFVDAGGAELNALLGYEDKIR
jgi:hypothetical protein